MSMTRVLLVAVLAVSVVPAMAVTVENYSWFQLSPRYTDSFVGNADGVWTLGGASGHGTVNDIRGRGFVWVPSPALTGASSSVNDGKGNMYWAAIQLDQPRPIERVDVQLWAQGDQAMVKQFYVDASLDSKSWVPVGFHDYGSLSGFNDANSISSVTPVSVTPGVYQYIRVRFEPGDYSTLYSNYGGPGVQLISPVGSGELAHEQVNWANKVFGTTITASMEGINYGAGFIMSGSGVQHLIDGDLAEHNGDDRRAGVNTGAFGNAESALWFELDLGQARWIDEVVGLWQAKDNWGTGFTVQYSTDGKTFRDVKDPSRTAHSNSLTGYTFDPVEARYWRITELTGNGWCLFEQIMMYGPAVPEPMTLSLLTIGGLAMLRRRK